MKVKQIKSFIYIVLVALLWSCANRGQGPTGGQKDEIPPRFVKSYPAPNSRNIGERDIELFFDENIKLKDVVKNVIISPPQQKPPIIKSYLDKLVVSLEDTLQANTTYSIDFGEAITDNNEGNVLPNMIFSFSTGSSLDTMQIAGTLLDAKNLNPVKGVKIGITTDENDSAFLSKPFDRIAQTDNQGRFTIYNVKNGKYRVYALDDKNKDNIYQRGEALAFDKQTFQTEVEGYMKQDTIWKDTVTIDTIKTVKAFKYKPNNVLLRFFHERKQRQYLVKYKREKPHKISLFFNTKADSLPKIKPLNCEWKNILIEPNEDLDTIHYWLTDSIDIKKDTILLQVDYLRTDTAYQLVNKRDTLTFKNKKKSDKETKISLLQIKTNIKSDFDINKPLTFDFDAPIKKIDTAKIQLYQYVDTIAKKIPFSLIQKDKIGKKFTINKNWIPETKYEIKIDSNSIINIFGQNNDKLKQTFTIKSETEYANLVLKITPFDSTAVFCLVDKNDKIIRKEKTKKEGVKVAFIEPNEYFVRIFLDTNNNGKWDTGNFLENRQPEKVFYYPKKLTLVKNWDFEETIDLYSTPLEKQKPKEIKKTINSKGEVQNIQNKR